MLKIEDFSGYREEQTLCWKRFSKDDSDYEAVLLFCFEPIKDNAWYQITIGQCFENEYKELEQHHFNSLKKTVNWWNEYFGEDADDELHFTI